MRVKVLRAGVFNGPGRPGETRHRALPWANEGEVVEVADGPYAESLLADGWVAAVVVASGPVVADRLSDRSQDVSGQRSGRTQRSDRSTLSTRRR